MRIVWRGRALIDLNGIEAFIERDNPATAGRWSNAQRMR
jgi:hypothetical protein